MFAFTILTTVLVLGLSVAFVLPQMSEISSNWVKYKDNPFVIFASPLLKPEDDKRTRMEFAADALKEGVSSQGSKVFQSFMDPVFSIFRSFSDTINTLLNSLMGIRMLFKNFFEGMLRILEPFQRRVNLTVSQLRKTFVNLNNALSKVSGVATGAVYAGISLIRTVLNMFELMKAVSIAILVILVAMVFWFWFILWPIIPLILVAISMLASAGGGESVSGMASAFCFAPHTKIQLSSSTSSPITKPINEIKIGDKLSNNSIVEGILEFEDKENKEQFYDYKGIIVSGSHIVYEDDKPIFVRDSEFSNKISSNPEKFYCLITSTRKIPVISPIDESVILFADWEEYDEKDIESLYEWNKIVFETLNHTKSIYNKPNLQTIESESAVAYETLVYTSIGKQKIHLIKPGMYVYDEKNKLTKVVGVVKIDPKLITGFLPLDLSKTSGISNACWIKSKYDEYYSQVSSNKITKDKLFVPSSVCKEFWHSEKIYSDCLLTGYNIQPWYNLITESGSFIVCDSTNFNYIVRDFSDIGQDKIETTYQTTINCLRKN